MEQEIQSVKVLVIDDSKTIRRSAENLLAKEGFEVITAIDGFDALAKIADARPEIIFVDIMMPRLDGYQTCALIKTTASSKQHRSLCSQAKTACLIALRAALSAAINTSPSRLAKKNYSAPFARWFTRNAGNGAYFGSR